MPCRICNDDGLVTLRGYEGRYTRGVTACRWCEAGKAKFNRLCATGNQPDMTYGVEDVEGVDEDHRPASPTEVQSALRLMHGNAVERLPPVHESNATIESRKTAAAQHARQAALEEAELPPEPAPEPETEPFDDSIPF